MKKKGKFDFGKSMKGSKRRPQNSTKFKALKEPEKKVKIPKFPEWMIR